MTDARLERGMGTKQRLLAAATRLFAERGFDGAATRDIALAAETTLPSITHHFGSKAGLYQAMLDTIEQAIAADLFPVIEQVTAALSIDARLSHRRAVTELRRLLAAHARAILGADPDWTLIVAREQLHPWDRSSRFADPFGERFLPLVTRLVALLTGDREDADEARVRALGLVGRVLVFRSTRKTALRLFGWPMIDHDRIEMIVGVLDREIEVLFPAMPESVQTHEAGYA